VRAGSSRLASSLLATRPLVSSRQVTRKILDGLLEDDRSQQVVSAFEQFAER
jgi:hypothetical protein